MRNYLCHVAGLMVVALLAAAIAFHILLAADLQTRCKQLPAPAAPPCCPCRPDGCPCKPRCECRPCVCDAQAEATTVHFCAADAEDPGYWVPHLEDRERFGVSRAWAVAARDFNRNLWALMQSKEPRGGDFEQHQAWQKIVEDLDDRHRAWDLIATAMGEVPEWALLLGCHSVELWQLEALDELHAQLGDEDYAAGRLPCHVPPWLFGN